MRSEKSQEIYDALCQHLANATAPPFLFVGSGFSQRYLGLPNWKELLDTFCKNIKPFQYYLGQADGDLAQVASLMSEDFYEFSWKESGYKDILVEENIDSKENVLKFFISKYLKEQYESNTFECLYPSEITKLENLNVDAIITTNWDTYLEDIFPEYATYIGQDEIVAANPYGVGEIYKIHGCLKQYESMVLTKNDYSNFNEKYPYLAAKLVTFLIEHPIVFIGYSLQDENVRKILENIVKCIGSAVQNKLRNNLIFVQRNGSNRNEGILHTTMRIDIYDLPITTITTDDFGIIYDAINSIKRKIPAKILRFVKNELYEIVNSSEPEKKIFIQDIEDVNENLGLEFVVGFGLKSTFDEVNTSNISHHGYELIKITDIIEDVLSSKDEETSFNNIDAFVRKTLVALCKVSQNTPIFKYLRILGINNNVELKNANLDIHQKCFEDFDKFKHTTSVTSHKRAIGNKSFFDIIKDFPPQKAAILIAHMEPEEIDIEELKSFIMAHELTLTENKHFSSYRKLVTIYDRLKFGWID